MRTNFESGRRFANPLDFQLQLDGWCERVNGRVHRTMGAVPAKRLAEERGAGAGAGRPERVSHGRNGGVRLRRIG
jgi:hypothetical protein